MADNKDEIRSEIIADMAAKDQAASDAGVQNPFQMEDMDSEQVTDSSTTSPKDETVDKDKDKSEPEGEKPEGAPDDKPEQPRDPQGKFAKQEPQPEPVPEAKESDYTKAQRGRERLDDIRKQAEADKAAARSEREATERLRAEFRQEIERSRAQPQGDASRFSAEEFERAGDWYEAEAEKAALAGDLDKFQELVGNARQVRRAAQATHQKQREDFERKQQEEFVREYGAAAEKIIAQEPDLGKESEASQEMLTLLERDNNKQLFEGQKAPLFSTRPDGFILAHGYLKMSKSHGKVTELSEKLTKAEAEVERLNKLVSPESGGPAPLERSQDFDNLPLEKRREIVRKQFEKADTI